MKKRSSSTNQLPVNYPSVPSTKSGAYRYNEPAVTAKADRVPGSKFSLRDHESRADLRLRIEQLLLTRDTRSDGAWGKLGEEGRSLMIELLDDEAIRSQEAIFHRLIAALGILAVKGSVAPLSAILNDESSTNLTRAYAANALGRIGEGTAIDALVSALTLKDEMVRRQIAIAFSRIDRETVIPHLIKLQRDKVIAVSEVAEAALRRWEQKLGVRFDIKGAKASKRARSARNVTPLPQR